MFWSRFMSVLSDKFNWTTACRRFKLQTMLQSPYFFFDVVYLHNGVEEAGDETSWRVSEQDENGTLTMNSSRMCSHLMEAERFVAATETQQSLGMFFFTHFHMCHLSPGQLHLVLQPGLKGNVLPLWGFPEWTSHRAAQLHGQTPGSPFTETIPEPRFLQSSGGGRPPGHWGNCLTCHSERPACLKTHPELLVFYELLHSNNSFELKMSFPGLQSLTVSRWFWWAAKPQHSLFVLDVLLANEMKEKTKWLTDLLEIMISGCIALWGWKQVSQVTVNPAVTDKKPLEKNNQHILTFMILFNSLFSPQSSCCVT